jgi:hypothetical protein
MNPPSPIGDFLAAEIMKTNPPCTAEDIFSITFQLDDSFTTKLQASDTHRYQVSYTRFSSQKHPGEKI